MNLKNKWVASIVFGCVYMDWKLILIKIDENMKFKWLKFELRWRWSIHGDELYVIELRTMIMTMKNKQITKE